MEVNRLLLTVLDIPRGRWCSWTQWLAHCRPTPPLLSLPHLDSLPFLGPSGGRKCGTWRWRKGYCLRAHALEAPLHIRMRPLPGSLQTTGKTHCPFTPGFSLAVHQPSTNQAFVLRVVLKIHILLFSCRFLSGFQNLPGMTIYKLNSTMSPSMDPLTG